MRRIYLFGPSILVLITAALTLVAGPAAIQQIGAARTAATVALAQQRLDDDDLLERMNQAIRDIATSVEPSVVFIETETSARRGGPPRATGSGWVYDEAGHIITNAHVARDAVRIRVQFQSGLVRDATFVGADDSTDIAVLKVNAPKSMLIPARRATGGAVFQGESVFAFGSPFGFKFSMSRGIVSGLGREAQTGRGSPAYSNFIQTDAAINPGNSGGPLVDVNGRVIGMNTAIIAGTESARNSTTGVSGGIGFAIPLDTVETVVEQLIDRGVVVRGFLGVSLSDVSRMDDGTLRNMGYEFGSGVYVSAVMPGLAADLGGVELGDIITRVNGEKTPTIAVLRSVIGNKPPGEGIALTVWRDEQTVELEVTLVAAVMNAAGQLMVVDQDELDGLADEETRLAAVKEAVSVFGVTSVQSGDGGVLIDSVRAGSEAEQIGFMPGQVVQRIQNTRVRSASDLYEALAPAYLSVGAELVEALVVDSAGQEQVLPFVIGR